MPKIEKPEEPKIPQPPVPSQDQQQQIQQEPEKPQEPQEPQKPQVPSEPEPQVLGTKTLPRVGAGLNILLGIFLVLASGYLYFREKILFKLALKKVKVN